MKNIIILGILTSVFIIIKQWKKQTTHNILLAILVNCALSFTLFENPILTFGFYLYGLSVIACLFYSIFRKDLLFKMKIPIILFFIFTFVNYVFMLFSLPYKEVSIICIIACSLVTIFTIANFKKYIFEFLLIF
jgi:hypothetical protein